MTRNESSTTRHPIRRKLEAIVGLPLASGLARLQLRRSKLEGPKQVFLPGCGIPLNYYEREAVTATVTATTTNKKHDRTTTMARSETVEDPPTVLLLHGLSGNVHELTGLVGWLKIGEGVRVLVPEHIGHGQDLKRAAAEGSGFRQPTPETLLRSTLEFLEVVRAGSNVNAFGSSLGGAILYYLNVERPGAIRRSVLYAPALPCVLADPFVDGLRDGTHQMVNFRDREDVKAAFRNLLWLDPETRRKKTSKRDPFPKLFYEVIYRIQRRDVPRGHYKALQESLLLSVKPDDDNDDENDENDENDNDNGNDASMYTATTDLDPHGHRLVVWGEDDLVCDHDRGRRFFEKADRTTFETIPDCGHAVSADGTGPYEILAPMVRDFLLDFSSSSSSSSS